MAVRIQLVCPPASLGGPLSRPRHAPHYSAIVAAALLEAGHEVELADQHLRTTDLATVVRDARAFDPDLLLLMHSDYNREIHPRTLEAVAAALKAGGVPVWGYGRLAEGHARAALEAVPSLDGVLFGEPEYAAVALAAGGEVPGSIRRDGSVLQPVDRTLERSPVPAWDLVAMDHYGFSPHQSPEGLVYPVLASRGCPYPCFYCEVRARPPWQARPIDAVIDEINALHDRYEVGTIFIADPTFAVKRDEALEFCRRLLRDGPPGLRWSCMSRTDRVDAELLGAMAEAGCFSVLFGVESLNPEALRRASKQLDPTTVGPAIRAAREAGLEVIASLMIGLPGDTPEGFETSLDQLIAMEPDFAQFFVVQIGEDELPEDGRLLSEWDGGRFDFWGHVYAPESFESKEQLLALRRRAFRRFYLRPGYVKERLRSLARRPDPLAEVRRLAKGGRLALRMATGRAPLS